MGMNLLPYSGDMNIQLHVHDVCMHPVGWGIYNNSPIEIVIAVMTTSPFYLVLQLAIGKPVPAYPNIHPSGIDMQTYVKSLTALFLAEI